MTRATHNPSTPDPAATRFRPQPLWVRVDRNRVKLAAFVVAFVAGSAALLTAALVGVPGALFGWVFTTDMPAEAQAYWQALAQLLAIAFGVVCAAGALASAVQLANAEDWVRNRFGGRAAKAGEYPILDDVLQEMMLASGLKKTPRLVVLETPAVNAYALGTARGRATVGVTRGFLESVPVVEQRAVVAALAARIRSGDILFATALAALMGPLKAVRDNGRAVKEATQKGIAHGGCTRAAWSEGWNAIPKIRGCGCLFGSRDSVVDSLWMLVIFFMLVVIAAITYVAVVIAAWVVTLWGRILNRSGYEKSDAEGMLLLKDPDAMLAALKRSIGADTTISGGDQSYDGIFYAPTSGTARVERAEARRLRRLAEVLGAEGAVAMR